MIATDELAELAPQIPEIAEFAEVADSARYVSVPDGWLVGTSDVVDSTGAIARGQYKSVNMVGAGVIAAVRNALGSTDVPFVFGGDGASFVVPGSAREAVAEALAATCVWAREETGLELRRRIGSCRRDPRSRSRSADCQFPPVTPALSLHDVFRWRHCLGGRPV